MRAFPASRELLAAALSALVTNSLLLFFAADIGAQQFPFGFLMQQGQIELTAPHVEVITGATASRLDQALQLVAARNWDEAVGIYREIAAEKTDRVVAIDADRFLNVRDYCQLQLSRLPPKGLASYRQKADTLAERSYRAGLANRDEKSLRRVVDEWFCSSWGDDALLALGEMALERGDYAAARHAWEQISPLILSPDGNPAWLSLRDIDLDTKWPEVEKRWQTRDKPPDWLAYPDTQINLADIRARLVLASIRAGELDRAALELQIFRRLHPDAVGQFGGQKENYLTALERLLATSRDWPLQPNSNDWPTFAGSHSRSRVAAALPMGLMPIWKEPIPLVPLKFRRSVPIGQRGLVGEDAARAEPDAAVRESQRPVGCYPIIVGSTVLFSDNDGIRAVDLSTGNPAITASGLLHQESSRDAKIGQGPLGMPGGVAHGVPRTTLDAAHSVVFTRVGTASTSRAQATQAALNDRIIGLDLRREGLLTFQSPRQDGAWAYDGAPVCDGERVFVAMRRSDVSPRAYIACFDGATGAERWRTPIGAADTIAGGAADEVTHNLLTLVEDRIYFNTNLGLVAALDAATGDVCWITRYDRLTGKTFALGSAVPLHFDRDPSPCVYHDGLLFVAPSDTPSIFALEADTGKIVWNQDQLPDALQLLAVVRGQLVVSGGRLSAVAISSGQIAWTWPESDHAGIRGMGRGVVAGDEIFWPTRNEILVIDSKTGAQSRPPISLSPLSGGANLAVSHGRLIVAGHDKLMVLGQPIRPAAKQIDPDRTGRQIASPNTQKVY